MHLYTSHKILHSMSGDISTDILRIHKSKVSQRNMWDGSQVSVSRMKICSRTKKGSFPISHITQNCIYIRVIKGPNIFFNYRVLEKIFL